MAEQQNILRPAANYKSALDFNRKIENFSKAKDYEVTLTEEDSDSDDSSKSQFSHIFEEENIKKKLNIDFDPALKCKFLSFKV